MKASSIILAISVCAISLAQDVAPWPLVRQDRFGTAKAPAGPAELTFPFTSHRDHHNRHFQGIPSPQVGPLFTRLTVVRPHQWTYEHGTFHVLSQRRSFRGRLWDELPHHTGEHFFVLPTARIQGLALRDRGSDFFSVMQEGSDHMLVKFRGFPAIPFDARFEELWRVPLLATAGAPNIGPTGDLFISQRSGRVSRLSQTDGSTMWNASGLGPIAHGTAFTRNNRLVLVSTGRAVRALRATTGTQGWRRQLPTTAGAVASGPDGTVVVGSSGGTVFGLNPADGTIRWQTDVGGDCTPPPAFDGTTVYMAVATGLGTGRIVALDTGSGAIQWFQEFSRPATNPVSVGHDGAVYVGVGKTLVCLNPDGSMRWSRSTQRNLGWITIDAEAGLFTSYLKEDPADDPYLVRVRQTPATIVIYPKGGPHSRVALGIPVPVPDATTGIVRDAMSYQDGKSLLIRLQRQAVPTNLAANILLMSAVGSYLAPAQRPHVFRIRAWKNHPSSVTARLQYESNPGPHYRNLAVWQLADVPTTREIVLTPQQMAARPHGWNNLRLLIECEGPIQNSWIRIDEFVGSVVPALAW